MKSDNPLCLPSTLPLRSRFLKNRAPTEAQERLCKKIKDIQEIITSSYSSYVSFKVTSQAIRFISISPCSTYLICGTVNGKIVVFNLILNKTEFKLPKFTNRLCSLSLSPNGSYILCGYTNEIQVWNISKRDLEFSVPISPQNANLTIFSPDGKIFVSCEDSFVVFWSFSEKKEIFRLGDHQSAIISISYSPDGKYLYTGCEDGTLIAWNVENKSQELKFVFNQTGIESVVISNNCKYAANASGNLLSVMNLKTQCEECKFEHPSKIYSLSFSSNNKYLASGSQDAYVRLFNIKEKVMKRIIMNDSPKIYSLIIHPNKKSIITGTIDGEIHHLKLNKKPRQIFNSSNTILDNISHASFSPDNEHIALSIYSSRLEIWNIRKNKKIFSDCGEIYTFFTVFSEDGSRFLNVSRELVNVWDFKTMTKIFTKIFYPNAEFDKFPVSKDFRYITLILNLTDLEVWDIKENFMAFNISRNSIPHSTGEFSNDCKHFACGFMDGYIGVWSITGKCEEYCLLSHTQKIMDIYYTEHDKYIVSIPAGQKINFWNTKEQKLEYSSDYCYSYYLYTALIGNLLILCPHNLMIIWNFIEKVEEFKIPLDPVRVGNISKYGNYLAEKFNYHIDIYNFRKYLEIKTMNEFKRFITPQVFSYDGKLALSAHQNYIKLWDVNENTELLTFYAHTSWIRSVSFSPDCEYILSAADDCSVKVWNLKGNEINYFVGHMSWVFASTFSKDCKYVASGSNDRVVKVWNVEGNGGEKTFRVQRSNICSIVFTNSGKYIAVELGDNSVTIIKIR